MTIEAIDHVQLAMPAGGEEKAIAFYEDLLGIDRVPKPPHLAVRGGCWFENERLKIHLGVEADFRPATKAHPALLVSDLTALIDRLMTNGVPVRDDEPLAGYQRAYVDDPFGNRIELMEPHAGGESGRSTVESEPEADALVMYGQPAEVGRLDWSWVDRRLARAGAYWVVAAASGQPHPRPLWGVWRDRRLYLSVGSPRLAASLERREPVTVHLGHDTEVVIVEGASAGESSDNGVLAAYNSKYEWDYTIATYGPFTVVEPSKVMAWRSAGWAGRGGFQQTGRWSL